MTSLVTPVDDVRSPGVPGTIGRASMVLGDLFAAVALVVCLPFAILAIGMPLVLVVRFLIWVVGTL
jgi:hypothetical protein